MRLHLRQLSGVAATLLAALLVLNSAFAQEPTEVSAQEAAADQAAAEQAAAEGAPAGEAATEEMAPIEMEAPPREVPKGLEEIVVTAEKREASLQDTPVAISAFTPETMNQYRITSPTDYTTLVPSLSYRGQFEKLFIRGVGRTANDLGMDPGVAIYQDGMYSSEVTVLNSSSFGLERIEFLRGPQGTLYGRNATGGAVNLISAKPEDELHFEGRIRLGTHGDRDFGLIATGPMLTDRLRFHVLATDANSNGGHQKNYGGRDGAGWDNRFYRAQIEADLTEDLTLWVLWNKLRTSDRNRSTAGLTPYYQDFTQPISFTPSLGMVDDEGRALPQPGQFNIHRANSDQPGRNRLQDQYSLTGSLTWDAGPVIVKYVYGFQTYDFNSRHNEFDGTPRTDDFGFTHPDYAFVDTATEEGINQALAFVREDKQQYSHELQITSNTDHRLQWLAGLYYYNEEIEQPQVVHKPFQDTLRNLCISCDIGDSPFTFPGPRVDPDDDDFWNTTNVVPNVSLHGGVWPGPLYDALGELKSEAYAVFGELYYDIDERFKLTTGLRYSYDRKHGKETRRINGDALYFTGLDYEGFTNQPNFPYPAVEDCCAFVIEPLRSRRLRDHWNSLTGRFVIDFVPDDDSMAYFSAALGYKAGGFRLTQFTAYEDEPIFDPEQNLAFEVGYKGTFMDCFRVNTAAFYYNYKDQQVLRSFYNQVSGLTAQSVVNAKKTIVYGLEVEAQAQVTDGLGLMATYSYNKGSYRDFDPQLDGSNFDWNGDGNPGPDGIVGAGPFDPDGADDGPSAEDRREVEGNDPVQMPEHKISLGATYTFFTEFGTLALTGRWSWVDETTYDIFNNVYAPSFSRFDYFVTYGDLEGRWTVIGYVKNATDEQNFNEYTMASEADGRGIGGVQNPGRSAGVEILLRF